MLRGLVRVNHQFRRPHSLVPLAATRPGIHTRSRGTSALTNRTPACPCGIVGWPLRFHVRFGCSNPRLRLGLTQPLPNRTPARPCDTVGWPLRFHVRFVRSNFRMRLTLRSATPIPCFWGHSDCRTCPTQPPRTAAVQNVQTGSISVNCYGLPMPYLRSVDRKPK